MCSAHYRRVLFGRDLAPPIRVRQPVQRDTLDLLTIDTGWWTADAIADRLGFERLYVKRALARMSSVGKVVGRQRVGSLEKEWRAE